MRKQKRGMTDNYTNGRAKTYVTSQNEQYKRKVIYNATYPD
jgi:hypothetical protein